LASLVELPQYAEWNLLLLELLHLVFVGHTPEAVEEAARQCVFVFRRF
jgi:hypothetical protein